MKKYNNYKDSGIEWIGKIPEHWEMWKISHSFKRIGSGTTPESGNLIYHENGTINWLNTGDLNDGEINSCNKKITEKALEDYSSLKLFPAGSLVMAMYGATIGKTSIINFDTTTNQACCVFCEGEIIDVKFLQYWFIGNKEHIINLAIGGGQPNISQNILKDVRVSCPSFNEQKTIANYLDHKTTQIETLIAKKEQFINLLEEERTAVINQAVTKGLAPKVKMKDSGIEWLGEIPEHWITTKMKFVCEFILDGTHSSHPRVDIGYRLLSVRNIIDGKFVFRDDDSCVSEEEYKKISSKFKIKKNDIQLAIVGATLGKVAIVDEMIEDYVTQRSLATIRSLESKCISNFLFNFIKSSLFQSYLWLNTGFSAQPGVYLGTLQNCTIPLPSISEQIEIVSYIQEISKRIDNLIFKAQQEIELLKEYKTALISEVVTGKVDVREVVLN